MARQIFSDASKEEALERAAEELGVDVDDLDCEVLEDNRDDESVPEEDRGVCIRVRVRSTKAGEEAERLLRALFEAMQVEAEIERELDETGERVVLNVSSPGGSVLIGREGRTLDAIQHWLTRATARVTLSTPALLVDIENYRSRKFENLERMARNIARQVVESGRERRLGVMGPVERKHVHNCLKDVDGVTTHSEGREGKRCIVIAPDDNFDDREPDELPEDEPLASESAYSQMRVIATPDSDGATVEDEELDPETTASFYRREKRNNRPLDDEDLDDEDL